MFSPTHVGPWVQFPGSIVITHYQLPRLQYECVIGREDVISVISGGLTIGQGIFPQVFSCRIALPDEDIALLDGVACTTCSLEWHVLLARRSGMYCLLDGVACTTCSPEWHVLLARRSGMYYLLDGVACTTCSTEWHVLLARRSGMYYLLDGVACTTCSPEWHVLLARRSGMYCLPRRRIIPRNYRQP